MNLADAGVLLVLGVLVVIGLRRGLVGQCLLLVAAIASVVVAALVAYLVVAQVGPENRLVVLAAPIAFFVSFVVASWTLKLMARGITRIVHTLPFAGLDRLLGALISMAVGGIILSLLCLGLVSIPGDNPISREARLARSSPYLLTAGRWTVALGARHLAFLQPLGDQFESAVEGLGGLDQQLQERLDDIL